MNYKRIYNELIEKRKVVMPSGTTELHHIIPKSMGGTDLVSNLVNLTVREHFIAHWLLWKIYRNKQMAYAFNMMRRGRRKLELHFTSHAYAAMKKANTEASSGSNNHMYGKKHSASTIEKMRLSQLGKPTSEETREKMRAVRKGKKLSASHMEGLKNQVRYTCEFCKKPNLTGSMLHRWHGDNCKHK